jgi:myo-inositol-1(or 4)-monophosphatase
MNLDELLSIAVEAAKKAGEYLNNCNEISIDSNSGKDIKLSSDRHSESIIIETLSPSGIPVLSEECGYIGEKSNRYWIIDPLDGSMNYYKGLDDFSCVSIALWDNGVPIIGVINRFACGEIFTGVSGGVARLNGSTINTSGVTKLEQAVMATGFPVKRDYSDEGLLSFFNDVRRFKKVRMLGSATLMAVFVACGRLDAYFEEDIMLWDIAAAMVIIDVAGGINDFQARSDYKCALRCFSTTELMEDYYA